MSTLPEAIRSIEDVCDVEFFQASGRPDALPGLLIEIPHGANRAAHFGAVRRRLVGDLPDDLLDFFFVNTDVGAPECAVDVARRVAGLEAAGSPRPRSVLIVRCLIPRTFVDCNRVLDGASPDYGATGMTQGLPAYVTDPRDIATLTVLHGDYHRVVAPAYDLVCGGGGLALMLHTYAPRSVKVERFDHGIAAALRAAYEPGRWETWPLRPDVDLITEAEDGESLAPEELVRSIEAGYRRIGLEPARNASYRLHPATMGCRYSKAFPGQALCIELNRGLLADPFSPFEEMTIAESRVDRLSAPIAAALLEEFTRRDR